MHSYVAVYITSCGIIFEYFTICSRLNFFPVKFPGKIHFLAHISLVDFLRVEILTGWFFSLFIFCLVDIFIGWIFFLEDFFVVEFFLVKFFFLVECGGKAFHLTSFKTPFPRTPAHSCKRFIVHKTSYYHHFLLFSFLSAIRFRYYMSGKKVIAL